ncbi:hypothetical protein SUGI_1515860 [Cryptomeria japonica]|uniref:At5g54830-like domain-containing protein n=1 Tax=Cryptomeria japonica TaxID=3369 RepID=A0AAD3NUV2_CRYJA|nr:hypothetical protein SUGI_1515860 [Cryptomeria japonica]
MLKFAPDASTPDLIYYQCYTHRFMGWRIRVVNSCSAFMSSLSRSSGAGGGGGGGGQRSSSDILGANNVSN